MQKIKSIIHDIKSIMYDIKALLTIRVSFTEKAFSMYDIVLLTVLEDIIRLVVWVIRNC